MPERAFIVGVQRCGTTYLYHLLDSHPQVAMAKPVRPEPKVFLDDSVTNDSAAYDARVFPENPITLVRGEKSTSYIENVQALRRISTTFPEARFVVCLRDPVERALSHFRFSLDNGVETRRVDQAIIDELEGQEPAYEPTISVSPFAYVRRGRYLEQLLQVERIVPRERLCVVVFEDLIADGEAVSEVFRFLDIDDGHHYAVNGVNASTSLVVMPAGLRDRLRAYFAPMNSQLADHLGRNLDRWQ